MKKTSGQRGRKNRLWIRSLGVAGSIGLLTSLLYFGGLFTTFENKTYDQRMIFSSAYKRPCDDIYFVGIDQESIDYAQKTYGWGWPWPREAYARMIDFFSAGNPDSIMFDILFTEPSVFGPEDDQALADAEKRSQKVVQPLYVTGSGEKQKAQFPIPRLKDNAALLGNITSLMDKDDIIRRGRLDYEYNGTIYPTLGTAPLYLQGTKDFSDLPKLADGSVLLRYQRNLDAYLPYSARDILSSHDAWKAGGAESQGGLYHPQDFEGGYIYIAYYAPGLFDICSTPVSQVSPGVSVHITTLDNYLTGSFMRKAPEAFTYIWFLFAALLAAFAVAFSSLSRSQRVTVIAMLSSFIVGSSIFIILPYLFFIKGIWINLIGAVFAYTVSFLVSIALSFTIESKQKRFIKAAFSQCLSKDVVNQIINDPASFTLGGKKFQMTAIFTDIQKFSSFSELLTAGELGCLLNFYLTRFSEIIIAEHGTVDKYEGDAIVAMVGAPVEMTDHAERACAAAIKMKKAEIVMNEEIERIAGAEKPAGMEEELYSAFKILVANKRRIFTRIGINSGEMIAGYFGSQNKKNYTMMGNNVNLASRLEGVNKQYRTGGILISEQTKLLAGDKFVSRMLDKVRVVNVNTPIRLYELLETKEEADEALISYIQRWNEAIEALDNRHYAECLEKIKTLKKERPQDSVADYYINLLEQTFVKGLYPTEKDDCGVAYNAEDGVFKLLQK